MSRYATQKTFLTADRLQGKKLVGSDVIVLIKGYEMLTFFVKTATVPTLKNSEAIEYTTTHGAKTSQEGYIQTYNEVPITFDENHLMFVKNTIEGIIKDDDNDLEVEYFAGRRIEDAVHLGTLKNAYITLEEGIEADKESSTTPVTVNAQLKGHYAPSDTASQAIAMALLQGALALVG